MTKVQITTAAAIGYAPEEYEYVLELRERVHEGHFQHCAKRFVGSAECTCGHADAQAELIELGMTLH